LVAANAILPPAVAFGETGIAELEITTADEQSAAVAVPRRVVPFSARLSVSAISEGHWDEFQMQPMVYWGP
jgi:hypothetical protein